MPTTVDPLPRQLTNSSFAQPLLIAQNLGKIYRSGNVEVHAVRDVSLTVSPGEIVMILGPSGSGKTTLLSMLGCLLRPDSGHISIVGRDVTDLSEQARAEVRRRYLGFIFQGFNLLSALTVLENVAVALNIAGVKGKLAEVQAREILERLDLGHRLNFKPAELSGGEKQRVAIARALVNTPLLVLADEPTANLDSQNGHRVVEFFRDLTREQQCGVVMVTHDVRVRDIATRVLHMEDGRLIEAP